MSSSDFRAAAAFLSSFITKYHETTDKRPIVPKVKPGFLRKKMADKMPVTGMKFGLLLGEFEKKIVPGLRNRFHPNFFGDCPTGSSYPSVLAEILATGYGGIGVSVRSNVALTELEIFALDLLADILHLPSSFRFRASNEKGGGCLHSSSAECVYISMLAARNKFISKLVEEQSKTRWEVWSKLVAYCSREAHSYVAKAAKLLLVNLRQIEVNENNEMTAQHLIHRIQEDQEKGLVPFYVCATFGTPGTGATDDLVNIAKVVSQYKFWYHIDAAYAGAALIIPKYSHYLDGFAKADSLNVSPYKWLLTNSDGAALYVKDRKTLTDTFEEEPRYFEYTERSDFDLSAHGISHERRFRGLKLYFTMRLYGKTQLHKYVDRHMELAQKFAAMLLDNTMFVITPMVLYGLVAFRLADAPGQDVNYLTAELLGRLNNSGEIYVTPHKIRGNVLIRFSVNSEGVTLTNIEEACKLIQHHAKELLADLEFHRWPRAIGLVYYVDKVRLEEYEKNHSHREHDCIFLPKNEAFPHTLED